MEYPRLIETERHRDMVSVFGGYNHQISCEEGQFYDMKNMTSRYFPILSTRKNRGIVRAFNNPQGILDKEDLYWIDDGFLYKNGVVISLPGVTLTDASPKAMAKMGAYIIIMPDKVWYNTETQECGYMEHKVDIASKDTTISFSICEANGTAITWNDPEYYKTNEAKDGDYMMSTDSSGKPSLKVYSETTGIWLTVASTYIQITAEGIGKGFEKEDGVKIICSTNHGLENVFVNTEEDGRYSTNTYILDRTDNSIVIPGIFGKTSGEGPETIELSVERNVPDMDFITECNNRLWGCSKDGHELYCCKLGDVKNWNCFRGISTDSWAATVGSDGKFTGAITYLGYPMFFKEDSFIKIAISTTGGHQTKETKCRGVQRGSERSLSILNETLYYKSNSFLMNFLSLI